MPRLREQLDEIADADIEFRAAVDRVSDFLKHMAYGSLTHDEIVDVRVWLIDAGHALKHLELLDRKYWPCGCWSRFTNPDCEEHACTS